MATLAVRLRFLSWLSKGSALLMLFSSYPECQQLSSDINLAIKKTNKNKLKYIKNLIFLLLFLYQPLIRRNKAACVSLQLTLRQTTTKEQEAKSVIALNENLIQE